MELIAILFNREAEEAEQQRLLEEEFIKEKEARKEGLRKRKPVITVKEKTAEELRGYSQLNLELNKGTGVKAVESKVNSIFKALQRNFNWNIVQCIFISIRQAPAVGGGFWTDEDLAELTRLTKKYPNGTLSRWEVIAEHMNRAVGEVTFMAARMKEPGNRPTDSVAEAIVQEAKKKTKKGADEALPEATWTQDQQKLLENAIIKYPKTTAGDRWQKISSAVPGKTKDECLARYKYLVQKVKEQKLKESAPQSESAEQQPAEVSAQIDRVETIESPGETAEVEDEPEPEPQKKSGGKPRNKRKERKKRMDFSSDEDE